MSDTILTNGQPVPTDRSHTEIEPSTGMQRSYVVLTPEERAKGFVKPVRMSYVHRKCGVETTIDRSIAETYARNPNFYNGTFCVSCREHFPLEQFEWCDGEPMLAALQAAWAAEQDTAGRARRQKRIDDLKAELAKLEAEQLQSAAEGSHK